MSAGWVDGVLTAIRDLKVLVVGDICLDRWCRYSPAHAEVSRETGIPRTAVISSTITPGAAGTIANNLVSLGVGYVEVLGAVGEDGSGDDLMRALAANRISADSIVRSRRLQTFTYTKLINNDTGIEDLPRVDFVNVADLHEEVESELLARLGWASASFDVVIVSDQAETEKGGVVSPRMREAVCALAEAGKLVWVDSRKRAEKFRHAVVKPNEDEAREASMRALGRVDFAALREWTAAPCLIVTHGGKGAVIYDRDGVATEVPGAAIEHPVDICGAGDSFTAGAATALKVTGSPVQAAQFGNLVASVTVMKPGTGTASPAEVREAASR